MPDRLRPDDRVALRALVDGYAVAADERDAEAFVGVFAPDGRLDVFGPDGQRSGGYRGHAELAGVTERLASRYERTLHLVSTHRVMADGPDAAVGVSYCQAHHLPPMADGTEHWDDRVMTIRYDDRYVRTTDGWAIAERQVHPLWFATERAERS